jgi:hypothetical protein
MSVCPASDKAAARGPCGLVYLSEYFESTHTSLLPRLDPTGFMRVKMDISLRKRALNPVRLVLEDSPMHSFI